MFELAFEEGMGDLGKWRQKGGAPQAKDEQKRGKH